MNRYEYENTLRDLLDAPWLQIRVKLPEDGTVARFNKVGSALDVSHVQMNRYLTVTEEALRETLERSVSRPETTVRRFYARDQGSFVGLVQAGFAYSDATARATFPILGDEADLTALAKDGPMTVGDKDPVKREREALGVVASSYEPIQPEFDRFHAPVSGRYRLRLRGHSFWAGSDSEKQWWRASRTKISRGRTLEPVTLYASSPPQQQRRLGTLDLGPESGGGELEVSLLKGESIRYPMLPGFSALGRPPTIRSARVDSSWHTPLATKEGQPGVAFQWLEVEGPIYDKWPTPGQALLAGNLPVRKGAGGTVEIVPTDPEKDCARLVRAFLARALRRRCRKPTHSFFVGLFGKIRAGGASFTEALLTTYSGILCSPGFVTLQEKPGPLDDFALASAFVVLPLELRARRQTLRVSGGPGQAEEPDGSRRGKPSGCWPSPRAQRFVEAFLDYWLDLRRAGDVSPDADALPGRLLSR